jgi:membrane fusion protein (multidrug efflux system)
VLDGLKAGDQVIVDGFQKLRAVKVVKPVPWQPAGSAAAGTSAASPAVSASSSKPTN